jgi:arginyl-tRNA synthetase
VPTIASQLESIFHAAIWSAFGIKTDPMIGISQNEKFGDYQCNVAMSLAKAVSAGVGGKTSPRQVAEGILAHLDLGPITAEPPTIAGPGFINIRLSPAWLAEQIKIQAADANLGIPDAQSRQTVVVDYSGPNIAKQMHVGHLRSTIIGDAIANVIEARTHDVIRQNHIGDWGAQFGMLITHRVLHAAARDELLVGDLEQRYRDAKVMFDADPEFQRRSREAVVSLQAGDAVSRQWWQKIVDETRRHYLPLYEALRVKLTKESERGESFYNTFLPDVVAELRSKGIAVESEGAIVVHVPDFESPLIIQKSDGGYLYGTTDLAAIRYRVKELHATRIIYTHDSRQQQHFAQVFWTARKAGWADGVSLEYAPFGTMLGEDNKPFKTRSGDTVKLKDLLQEAELRAMSVVESKSPTLPTDQKKAIAHAIGIGAVKYSDLSKDRTSDYVFSWDKMLSMEGNTAPYLQYVYARIRSIFRKAGADSVDRSAIVLQSSFELALAREIARFGEAVDSVSRELKPHILCTYLYDLASRFSSFYENCPVLQSDDATKASRLAICDLTASVMARGLDLLGIEHPEQM